jgi:predicted kinase
MTPTAILFIGIPATGKSTFYKTHFFHTHMRLNLDMLKTRYRETLFLNACIEAKQPFVVDNTNVTKDDRARYIEVAKRAGFTILGYYFQSKVQDAINRNALRDKTERVPDVGILGKAGQLQIPTYMEGFDRLYYVSMIDGDFVIQDWQDEL